MKLMDLDVNGRLRSPLSRIPVVVLTALKILGIIETISDP